MLKLKLQYFGHLMWRADSLKKTLMLEKIEGRGRRGWEDEMVAWHHWLNGHDFEQALAESEGQGSLAWGSPWGCEESDTTERLNNKERRFLILAISIHSGCYNKRISDWVAYKQQTFITRSSGAWEVQDQGTSTFSAWWEPASWLIDGPCAHMKNGWGSSLGLLHKGTNPIHKGSTFMIYAPLSWSNHLRKSPPPNTLTLGIRFQQINLGDTQTFSLQHLPFKCQVNWHLLAKSILPETEQQWGHLPSASAETESCAAAAAGLQYPLRECRWRVRHSRLQGNGGTSL